MQWYQPTSANIGLTRRCNLNCSHCAPASYPTSSEELSPEQIKKFLTDLNKNPCITHLYIEGGEPTLAWDLLIDTLERIGDNTYIDTIQLETNLSWASSPQKTKEAVQALRFTSGLTQAKQFILATSFDHFHALPPDNILNLLRVFFNWFSPTQARIAISHTLHPGENKIVQLSEFLEKNGIPNKTIYDRLTGTVVTSILPKLPWLDFYSPKELEIKIENKYPVYVGRAENLRHTGYSKWARTDWKRTLSFRENESIPFDGRGQILSLGWDGLYYASPMFMHSGQYPIGDVDKDNIWSVIDYTEDDPILRRLFTRGTGSIYRLARRFMHIPDELLKDTTLDSLAFHMLCSPYRNKLLVRAAIAEDENIKAMQPTDIESLLKRDWLGIEDSFVNKVTSILSSRSNKTIIDVLSSKYFFGEERDIFFNLLAIMKEEGEKEELYQLASQNAILLEKIHPEKYFPGNIKDYLCRFMIALGENKGISKLIEEAKKDTNKMRELKALMSNLSKLKMYRFFNRVANAKDTKTSEWKDCVEIPYDPSSIRKI